jgi:hypothetical protein
MAILIATSSLDLSQQERRAFIENAGQVLKEQFDDYAVYFGSISNDTTSPLSRNQTHFIIYVPADFPIAQRRELAVKLHEMSVAKTESRGKFANIVIFKYLGADGIARDSAQPIETTAA